MENIFKIIAGEDNERDKYKNPNGAIDYYGIWWDLSDLSYLLKNKNTEEK